MALLLFDVKWLQQAERSEIYYTSQPESTGELVTMATRKVFFSGNAVWIAVIFFFFFF